PPLPDDFLQQGERHLRRGSKDLCTHILREEWGFDGAVVTDWGDMDIVVDGADAVAAGNDVVMPGGPPVIQQILKGLEEGRLTRQEMETAVGHLLSMVKRLGRLD
ncbi:MAG: glycoside hydrolase family 3 N-terminal domain-containing protein, partial [Acutalibacter sp.]